MSDERRVEREEQSVMPTPEQIIQNQGELLTSMSNTVVERNKTIADLRQQLAELMTVCDSASNTIRDQMAQNAAQAAEIERLRAHNETLVREHKDMAVEVSALHVEIENMRYAADVGLTEEANRAERWIGHARRLFKLKCEYSQKCREKDAELATLRERLEAAEKMLIEVYRHVGNSSPKRHALPPGLRDRIRDYTKANCAERAGWLPPASTTTKGATP